MQAITDEFEEGQYSGCTFEPQKFASIALAEDYSDSFDEYIELRVHGIPRDLAAIEAFNMIGHGVKLDNAEQIGMACDVNPYVKKRFPLVLASKDAKRDLWTVNDAVNNYLRIIKDPREKGSVRLSAINALTALCGYAEIDELTGRRVDKTIAEFKRLHATWQAAGSPTTQSQSATTH